MHVREQEKDFIKRHNTHGGHKKKAPACCYGALSCTVEYISGNPMLIVNTEQGPGSYEKHREYFSSYSSFIFQMAEYTAGIFNTLVTSGLSKLCHSHPEVSQ